MTTAAEPRWLDPDATAAYLSVRVSALPRLQKAGRIPEPSYALGPRLPRWDRLALDGRVEGGAAWEAPGLPIERRGRWPARSGLRRVADALPGGLDRAGRVRALGNAVVPGIAAMLGRAILRADGAA